MAAQGDRNPDLVVAAFLAAVAKDRAVGERLSLADYQRRFPGYEHELLFAWESLSTDVQGQSLGDMAVDLATGECNAGDRFAGYLIRSVLGRGGQAVVYDAFDEALDRSVALKVLHTSHLGSVDARRRFAREIELTIRLEHSSICPVYACGSENGTPWIAMRALRGMPLSDCVADVAASDWRLAVRYVLAAAGAIAHAHGRSVVHRDLKPANLWCDEEQRIHVLDFGLAADQRPGREQEPQLTRVGDHFGTPGYMAPEQLAGGGTSACTDVFALGVILFELLTAKRPYPSATVGGYERAVSLGPPDVCGERRNVPRDLASVLRVAMAVAPVDRYVDASSLASDLEAVLSGRAIEGVPPGPWRRLLRWAARERRLAATLSLLFLVTIVSVVMITLALGRADRNAGRAAITAASALLRSNQIESARSALELCPAGSRGFAYQLLRHQLEAGLPVLANGSELQRVMRSGPPQAAPLKLVLQGRELLLPAPPSKWLLTHNEDASRLAVETVQPGRGGTRVHVYAGDGRVLCVLDLAGMDVTSMAFAPDTGWLWCAVRRTGAQVGQFLQAWSVASGDRMYEREVAGARIASLLVLANHRVLLGGRDGVIQLQDPAQKQGRPLCWHRDEVVAMQAVRGGFVSEDVAGHQRRWDLSVIGAARVLWTGPNEVRGFAWRDALQVWSTGGPLLAWLPTSHRVVPFGGGELVAATVRARHPIEPLIAFGQSDGSVLLLLDDDEMPLASLQSGDAAVTAVAFRADGKQLAIGHADGRVAVFSVQRWPEQPASATGLQQRAEHELSVREHECQLLFDHETATSPTWLDFACRRLCQRRLGATHDDLRGILELPFAAMPMQAYAADLLDAIMSQPAMPARDVGLFSTSVMAQLRTQRFARLEQLLAGAPPSLKAYVPVWRGVASILRSQAKPGAALVALGSRMDAELALRQTGAGRAAFAWLEQQCLRGVTLVDLRANMAAADLAPEVAAAVDEALHLPLAHAPDFVEVLHGWLAHRRLPKACWPPLSEWAAYLEASAEGAGSRATAARAAGQLRCGDVVAARRLLAPLLAGADDWRQLDFVVAAYGALAAKPGVEARRWADRARAIVMTRAPGTNLIVVMLLAEMRDRIQ